MTSKKYIEKSKQVNPEKSYVIKDAVQLLKSCLWAKFDETVDLAIKLGVDLKKIGGSVRGTLVLPFGTGKEKKVAAITSDALVKDAEKAGACAAGSNDLIEKIKNGFFDFDVLLATPDMMPQIGKLGRVLGSKGLMPNPKSGTVTPDIVQAIKEFKKGKIEFKAEKGGVIHIAIGKASFDENKIYENLIAVLKAIYAVKPSGIKGEFMKSFSISSTMGPGIKLDKEQIKEMLEAGK